MVFDCFPKIAFCATLLRRLGDKFRYLPYELVLIFFLIALLYSSAGFGGGSSYLAVLALYSFDYDFIRLAALACNCMVVTGSVLLFHRAQLIDWRKIFPLIALSVPLAFLGARMRVSEVYFFIILGFSLLLAAILLWLKRSDAAETEVSKQNVLANAGLGGSIGLLSGFVGIGGGIFLSPILHFMRWDTAKRIAACASAFILVNSIAGLFGLWSKGMVIGNNAYLILFLLGAVLVGGQLGARTSIFRLKQLQVRKITSVLIFAVAVRILYKYLIPLVQS